MIKCIKIVLYGGGLFVLIFLIILIYNFRRFQYLEIDNGSIETRKLYQSDEIVSQEHFKGSIEDTISFIKAEKYWIAIYKRKGDLTYSGNDLKTSVNYFNSFDIGRFFSSISCDIINGRIEIRNKLTLNAFEKIYISEKAKIETIRIKPSCIYIRLKTGMIGIGDSKKPHIAFFNHDDEEAISEFYLKFNNSILIYAKYHASQFTDNQRILEQLYDECDSSSPGI